MPSLYTFLCLSWLNRGSLKHYFMSVLTSPTVLGSTATAVCSARPAQSLWPRTTLPATVQQQDAPHHHCSANTRHTHLFLIPAAAFILKLLLILFISCAQTHFTYCCTHRAGRVFQLLPWRQFYFKVWIFFFSPTCWSLILTVSTETAQLWRQTQYRGGLLWWCKGTGHSKSHVMTKNDFIQEKLVFKNICVTNKTTEHLTKKRKSEWKITDESLLSGDARWNLSDALISQPRVRFGRYRLADWYQTWRGLLMPVADVYRLYHMTLALAKFSELIGWQTEIY